MITNKLFVGFVKRLRYNFMLILLFLAINNLNAQFSQNKRADKLFTQSKYEHALNIYLSIYQSKKPAEDSLVIIDKIAQCYRLTRNNENALIWYKKLLNIQESNNITYFYYAQLLNSSGQKVLAEKWFKKY